ncbi:MAG: hypothetical protein SV760_00020 [Halobacteria archaeon]|nr:hypothetical protein [Halobacteria archaeon]
MTDLTDFTNDDETDEQTDRFDRSNRPDVRRLHGVRSDDGNTLYGMIGRDRNRDDAYVYSSPRNRDENYFRKIGGYPINVDVLERLRSPPDDETPPVKIVYIIQIESTDDHPPYTVFEYDLRDYIDAETIDFSGYGKQKCPTLDDARAVWPAKGEIMFATGEL